MVSLVDANLPLRHGQTLTLSKLACASQRSSLYLQIPRRTNLSANNDKTTSVDATNHICEIQAIPTDFGSFLVTPSNTVIGKDSNLYVTTIVDPLFLVLQQSDKFPDQWQPWEQIVESCMDTALKAVLPSDKDQFMHLFARMPIDDEEVYYKFSTCKALAWLQKKFVKVQQTLEQQQEESTMESNGSTGGGIGTALSAMASTFVIGNQGNQQRETRESQAAQAQKRAAKRERTKERCRADAVQILCDYLNETWKIQFLQHVDLDASLLASPTDKNKTGLDNSSSASEKRSPNDLALPPPTKKPKVQVGGTTTVGYKKLAKTNVKGMQRLSAFFSVKKENVKNKNN